MLDLAARCRAISTSTWSDALDRLGLTGVIQGVPLVSGSGRAAGRAVTVRESACACDAVEFAPGDFLDAVDAGCMLVLGASGAPVSTFGGLAALAAAQKNAAGVVIDGACRDLEEIRAAGIWVAARAVTPVSGKGRIRTEAVGVPVTIGGVLIEPGDFVIGDETGIVCVPAARVEEALAIGEHLARKDEIFASRLRQGKSFRAAASELGHI